MLKAVLFDLDNTLIRFDELTFFENYVPKISRVFSDIMPPDVLLERLLLSTKDLMRNNGKISNAEHFMNSFSRGYEQHREEMWGRFLRFYETEEFDQFQYLVTAMPGARDVFSRLQQAGVKLVIASNPIWPQMVQRKRLSWAGLGDFRFDLVTDIENMSYCKPRLEYYQQVCGMIKEKPESCLMVGNDPVNDLVVAKIAMKTYLIVDHEGVSSALELSRSIRDDSAMEIPEPDFKGTLSGVLEAVESLLR